MKVLLYYHFARIANPTTFVAEHKAFCKNHNLKGRILVNHEGINGTCGGEDADIDAYKVFVRGIDGFSDIWFKEQDIDHQPFPRLSIRERKELVTLRLPGITHTDGGRHLEPSEVNEMAKRDDVVFFDARNEIEGRVGKFKNAIVPPIRRFYELPKVMEQYEDLKDKHIIMYCTGGIRCETATTLFKKHGFKNVYQIKGGIYNYCQQYPKGLFEGTCYVFDDRLQIGWEGKGVRAGETIPDTMIISSCEFCGQKSARVVNDERVADRCQRIVCLSCDTKLDISRIRSREEVMRRQPLVVVRKKITRTMRTVGRKLRKARVDLKFKVKNLVRQV